MNVTTATAVARSKKGIYMNKLVPIIAFSLAASIFAAWYLANKQSSLPALPSNTLIVGINTDYAPFSFIENDTISGFDIDLVREIADRLGKTIELRDMPFDSLIPALQIGSVHFIASGITPTKERASRVLFTKPYLTGDPLLLISTTKNTLTSLDQLKDKKVAVNEGYTADYYMAKVQGPELIRFATPFESFMALNSERVDALVMAQHSAKKFIEQLGAHKFVVTPIPDTTDEYALAISKRHPELLEPIQKALDDMQKDGTFEQLKKKWKL